VIKNNFIKIVPAEIMFLAASSTKVLGSAASINIDKFHQ